MALKLREAGYEAYVIAGGLKEWAKANYPLELVPEEDVLLLPVFS